MAVLTTTGRAEGLWGTTLLFEGLSRGGGGVIRWGVKGSKGGWLERVWWEEESFLEKIMILWKQSVLSACPAVGKFW